MRKLYLLSVLIASTALAGDRLLGVILVTDGGTVSNASTGYGSAGCAHAAPGVKAGACAQSFPIASNSLLSVQCKDQAAMFVANFYTVDAGDGIKLAADQLFTTSVGRAVLVPAAIASVANPDGGAASASAAGVPDGGTYVGGVVAISPITGNTRAECNIYDIKGNE